MSRVEEITRLYDRAKTYSGMKKAHSSNPYISSMLDDLDRDIQLNIAKSLAIIADAVSDFEEE